MNWYLTKIIYQIVCGAGQHTAQFDEQLRLIEAATETEALEKAVQIGLAEEETFCNEKAELVQWKFVNVSELYSLTELTDGAEIYSRIAEVEDAAAYISAVHLKAASLLEESTQRPLQLI